MKTEREVAELVARLYTGIGGDARDLTRVVPLYGTWYTALKYEIVRADGSRAVVSRKDIDNGDQKAITDALRSFCERARPRLSTSRRE